MWYEAKEPIHAHCTTWGLKPGFSCCDVEALKTVPSGSPSHNKTKKKVYLANDDAEK